MISDLPSNYCRGRLAPPCVSLRSTAHGSRIAACGSGVIVHGRILNEFVNSELV